MIDGRFQPLQKGSHSDAACNPTMSKVNQDPTRPSRKYTGSARKDPRKGPFAASDDRASISDSSIIILGATSSLHSIHALSSRSSLSCASDVSAHSRPFRIFKASSPASPKKRTRLLPRAYKRGGKNKPIVVHDSSSGEFQSPSLSNVSLKDNKKGKAEIEEENRLTENR